MLSSMSSLDIKRTISRLHPLWKSRSASTWKRWHDTAASKSKEKTEKGKMTRDAHLVLKTSKKSSKQNLKSEVTIASLNSLQLALSECVPHSTEIKKLDYCSNMNPETVSKHTNEKSGLGANNMVITQVCTAENKVKCTGVTGTSSKISFKNSSNKSMRKIKDETGLIRQNGVNIQMLSLGLFQQLFGQEKDQYGPSPQQLQKACEELQKHNLLTAEKPQLDDVDLKLPSLEGSNIEEHFYEIGENQSSPYRTLLEGLVTCLPPVPEEWVLEPGWTRYNGVSKPQSVPFPAEDALVFDVEVCQSAGQMPTLATAASPQAWYGWVSRPLSDGAVGSVARQHYSTEELIPMESGPLQRRFGDAFERPRVVVGHNVSYDRARIKEQYWLEGTAMRFVDTMSMHVCVSGVTSFQRAMLKAKRTGELVGDEDWRKVSSLNSLIEVHKLYCGETLDKGTRDMFVQGSLSDVHTHFQKLMHYCAGDVMATHNVLCALLPLFLERFPHPVTLAGMLELSTAYLPVNSNWSRYLADAQQTFEDLNSESRFLLGRRADEACQLLHNENYRENIWLWDQDWSIQELRLKKNVNNSSHKINSVNSVNGISVVENDTGLRSKIDHPKKSLEENKKPLPSKQNVNVLIPSEYKSRNSFSQKVSNEDVSEEDNENHLKKRFEYLENTRALLPVRVPHLPGYPAWYRKLCPRSSEPDWVPGPQLVSTAMQVTPKLLSLTWESYPLHYIRHHGWGLLVPYSTTPVEVEDSPQIPLKQLLEQCPILNKEPLSAGATESDAVMNTLSQDVQDRLSWKSFTRRNTEKAPSCYHGTGVWCNMDVGECCWFLKLPHKDGSSHRVGNPLAKDFLNKFSENVLSGADAGAEKVLDISRKLSYWRNNHERVERQLVVWLSRQDLPRALRVSDMAYGAIVPQVVVCGTLTRRAVEPTWMTASNAQSNRVGSELRAMVQAPPGYSIVGADVDSQELWIAAVIGDAHFAKLHGSTPFGWMTLSGRKADGTDMHSVTASAIGISRDHAKVINYARIYGAGQQFAERLLKQFNPVMSDTEAKKKAAKMFALTKGRRVYHLKGEYRKVLDDRQYSMYEAIKMRKAHGVSLEEMFEHPKWIGGTESAMFNRLEEIASSSAPATPFLGGRLSRALESDDDRYLPTRVNWVVQSGAVDFLHLMLVSMRWLADPRMRFCLSFHDEVRYLVPNEQRYHTALAMHVTNLLVRAFCARRLGLADLPQSVAFFTSVEVDTVLRKEAHHDCCTPSNPHGLLKGYGIPQGESLDIHQVLLKTGGTLRVIRRKKRCLVPQRGST